MQWRALASWARYLADRLDIATKVLLPLLRLLELHKGICVRCAQDLAPRAAESKLPVYGGAFIIETENRQSKQSKTQAPTSAKPWQQATDVDYCCFLNCGALPTRSCTPARDTTRAGSAFSDTWPAVDVYEYVRPYERPYSQLDPPRAATLPRACWDMVSETPSDRTDEDTGKPRGLPFSREQRLQDAETLPPEHDEAMQQQPATRHPDTLQPIMGRSIGFDRSSVPQVPSRVYGGITGSRGEPKALINFPLRGAAFLVVHSVAFFAVIHKAIPFFWMCVRALRSP